MVKRTNRVAWGLVVVMAVVLMGGCLLIGLSIPAYVGVSPGPYAVGVLVGGRWIGPAPVDMHAGRLIKVGFLEFNVGRPLTK